MKAGGGGGVAAWSPWSIAWTCSMVKRAGELGGVVSLGGLTLSIASLGKRFLACCAETEDWESISISRGGSMGGLVVLLAGVTAVDAIVKRRIEEECR